MIMAFYLHFENYSNFEFSFVYVPVFSSNCRYTYIGTSFQPLISIKRARPTTSGVCIRSEDGKLLKNIFFFVFAFRLNCFWKKKIPSKIRKKKINIIYKSNEVLDVKCIRNKRMKTRIIKDNLEEKKKKRNVFNYTSPWSQLSHVMIMENISYDYVFTV